eukprot:2577702-Lingulodinium_polyedra.AAC.1
MRCVKCGPPAGACRVEARAGDDSTAGARPSQVSSTIASSGVGAFWLRADDLRLASQRMQR